MDDKLRKILDQVLYMAVETYRDGNLEFNSELAEVQNQIRDYYAELEKRTVWSSPVSSSRS